MKTRFSLFCLLMCCLLSSVAIAQTRDVPITEALAIAQKQFLGKDVDYFLLQEDNCKEWTIFVDAEPMKGWEHECYIVTIPKTALISSSSLLVPKSVKCTLPPNNNYSPLLVKNRYGTNATSKPVVTKEAQSNADKTAAQRTYAIIISGGINKLSNYERYWNDCSFIYQTLVNKYEVPKENIFPIMSDGTDPAVDMRLTTGGFASQSLDLDNDGVADIKLAATINNIQATLNTLSTMIHEEDHLFFYVIDHGGTTDYNTNSYICLWNEERLYDYQLAEMLDSFIQKDVNVNVVLGQCYSGGFNDNLTKAGCVVAAASSGSESSWACSDIPYDEFVYQWTTAINGANHCGVKVNSDTDSNGRITMEEAFAYAKNHDRRSAEHPQYVSTPIYIGEDLAFNHHVPGVDLYVKDNPEDTGKEPNTTTDKFWLSPSIWVRNNADNGTEHENPYYSEDHVAAIVYVRIHNRGKNNYEGGTKYVHLYWAKASTGFRPDTWMGNETYVNGEVTGGPMTPYCIPRIDAGKFVDVPIVWSLPSNLLGSSSDNGSEKHHFCLLAKILDTHIEPWYYGTFSYDCKLHNNDAQKNVSIISKKELSTGTNIFIRNIRDVTQKYSLELVPRETSDEAIFKHASIVMEMSQPIFNAWEIGGAICNDIERVPSAGPRFVEFLSKDSKLESISLAGQEFDKVSLKFNFKPTMYNSCKYTIDLIQRTENGEIVGGESFIVESPHFNNEPVIITPTPIGPGQILLSADVAPTQSVRWENKNGMTIGYENTVEVFPTDKNDNIYYVYVQSKDGEISHGSIELNSKIGFKEVYIDDNLTLNISLQGHITTNSSIVLSSAYTGDMLFSQDIGNNENHITINVSSFKPGIYVASYICNGEVIDTVKLTI